MAFLYDRIENDKEIVIRYKYQGLYSGAAILLLLSIFINEFSNLFLFAFLIFFTMGIWKPGQEVRKAMKHGSVSVSGSKFPLSNPLTVVITKQPS